MSETAKQKRARALQDVPTMLLADIFARLDQGSHAALAAAAPHFRQVARLPGAACLHLEFSLGTRTTGVSPLSTRHAPRSARIMGPVGNMARLGPWLMLTPQRLAILVVQTLWKCDFAPLAGVASLRHLVLIAPMSSTVASAIAACGGRLRTLRLLKADAILLTQVVYGVPGMPPRTFSVQTLHDAIAGCRQLEAFMLHGTPSSLDTVPAIADLALPNLRSLALVQQTRCDRVASLSSLSLLSSLYFHLSHARFERDLAWPTMPQLRSLDLGAASFECVPSAFARCFPGLRHLRAACVHPAQLAALTSLTSLVVQEVNRPGWLAELGGLFPELPRLRNLAVLSPHQPCDARKHWHLQEVTHLALDIPRAAWPTIAAPALEVLRGGHLDSDALAEIVGACPHLKRVEYCKLWTASADATSDPLSAALDAGRVDMVERRIVAEELQRRGRKYESMADWL